MATKHYYFRNVSEGHIVKTSCPMLYSDKVRYTPLKRTEGERLYVQQQRTQLTADLQAAARNVHGDSQVTVYAVIRKVSASGMKHTFDFYLCINGDMQCITYNVATVLSLGLNNDRGLVRIGGNMDMVYDTVDMLWQALHFGKVAKFDIRVL